MSVAAANNEQRLQRAQAASDRLCDWLLHGPAQVADGAEAGGVAGTVDSTGQADYVYGEITGYYLHWLAGSHLQSDPRRPLNARLALAWCERRYSTGAAVPTRIALRQLAADWRNQTEFCFDLAMLVGGLTAAAQAGLIEVPRQLLEQLLQRLRSFAGDGRLLPVAQNAGAAALPDRWSTRSGPFLVKAAARILSAGAIVDMPEKLAAACRGHLQLFAPTAVTPLADPLHPTLYFLEGLLALTPASTGDAVTLLQALLAQLAVDGTLPESLDSVGVRRSDIIAQALRLLLWLQQTGQAGAAAAEQAAALVDALCARVGADGSIDFQPVADGAQPQRNVWCAMFAQQALSWFVQLHCGEHVLNAAEIV